MRSSDRPASLARRVLPAVALTGLSGVLLTQLDRPEPAVSISIGTRRTTTTLPNGAPANTSGAAPVTSGAGNGSIPDPNATTGMTQPTTSTPNSSVTTPPGNCTGSSFSGQSVDTRWGPVQVTAVVSTTGVVCSATATGPNDRRRSIMINDQALPLLNEEAVSQGINFDSVSGATVTSNGYRSSLQSLLDAAKK